MSTVSDSAYHRASEAFWRQKRSGGTFSATKYCIRAAIEAADEIEHSDGRQVPKMGANSPTNRPTETDSGPNENPAKAGEMG